MRFSLHYLLTNHISQTLFLCIYVFCVKNRQEGLQNSPHHFNQLFVLIPMHGRNKWSKALVALSKAKLMAHCELWDAVLLEMKPVTLGSQQSLTQLHRSLQGRSLYLYFYLQRLFCFFCYYILKIQYTVMKNSLLQFYY